MHVRLTKACNADCSYCSSWKNDAQTRMKPEEFRQAIDWLMPQIERYAGKSSHMSIEYIGGEILTIPQHELTEIVMYLRRTLSEKGIKYRDGVQTNLIGSIRRIDEINSLFEGRVGTSLSRFTDERTVNGSSEKYIKIFDISDQHLSNKSKSPTPVVITITTSNIPVAQKEVLHAFSEGRNITVRPVFEGGKSVTTVNPNTLSSLYNQLFDRWFMRYKTILEPHHSLLSRLYANSKEITDLNSLGFLDIQKVTILKSITLG